MIFHIWYSFKILKWYILKMLTLYRCQRVCSPHCLTCYPSRKPHSARSWLTQCPRWHSHCPQNTRVSPNYRQILRNVCSEIFHTAGLGSLPRVPDSLTQEDPGNSPSLIKTTITKTDNWAGIILFIWPALPASEAGRLVDHLRGVEVESILAAGVVAS